VTQTADTAATADGAAQGTAEPAFEELARAVDDAARAAGELAEPARQVAQDLRAAIEAAHRAALVTIVRRLRADPATREALFELAGDPLVHMLLSLHGIIRPAPVTGPEREPAAARPPAPVLIPLTALRRRDGMEQEPGPGPGQEPGPGPGPGQEPGQQQGWVRTAAVSDLPASGMTPMRLVTASGAEEDVILVRLADGMAAFRDKCAHQALPLSGGLLDPVAGTLTCPWHGYCYDAMSGECMSAPGAALTRLPVRVEAGHVWVQAG
jgi:nitrite reductase/ring-hydroxylating ferredoxin subunit